jgi:hypothetical protein
MTGGFTFIFFPADRSKTAVFGAVPNRCGNNVKIPARQRISKVQMV